MNQGLFSFLNNFALQSENFDVAVIFTAQWLIGWLVAGVVFLLFFSLWKGEYADERKLFLVLVGAFVAWLISQAFNILFPEPRPFLALETVKSLFLYGGMDSFPSGHATIASALAVGLFYFKKPIAWLYLGGGLLVGFSRVIAGVHWPADIVAGFLLGGVVAALAHLSYEKLRNFS